MKVLALTLLLAVPVSAQPAKRLYIEEKFAVRHGFGDRGIRDVHLEATKQFQSSCAAVSVTGNREVADYVLRLSQGNSVLYKQNGDVAYISPAKTMRNATKDVCQFVGKQP